MDEVGKLNLIELTVDLVAAFVSNNIVGMKDVPDLIASTHRALAALGGVPAPGNGAGAAEFVPAVSVRKSLASRDHIVSMIDGKPYRSLRRHLTARGLTPDAYRERYNLPASYPMVAPSYSEARSELAKARGLGRKKNARRARSGR